MAASIECHWQGTNKNEPLQNELETSNCVMGMDNMFQNIRRLLSDSIARHGRRLKNGEERFKQRLSKYSCSVWSVKPRVVAPPICASLGWAAVEKDLLECVACKQFLSTELPPIWKHFAHERALSKLVASLTDRHHQFCPWPLNMSKQNYLHERFLDFELTRKSFVAILNEFDLLDNAKKPQIAHELPEELQMACEFLVENFTPLKSSTDKSTIRDAILLAMCGWQAKYRQEEDGCQKLFCTECFRETETFLYSSPYKNDLTSTMQESTENDTPMTKRRRNSLDRPFHPLNDHQSWCPWVDANYTTTDGSSIKEGWKIHLKILTTHSEDGTTERCSKLPINSVLMTREIISKWITDVSLHHHVD